MATIAAVPKPEADRAKAALSRKWLALSVKAWFVATAFGQIAFAAFILLYYYPPTFAGRFAAWNNKPLIDGHIPGDTAGNLGFAVHVVVAAVMTLCGLVQLVPAIRTRWPRVHRWSGRTFLAAALVLALGGLALVWVRGTYLTLTGAIAITLDCLLIVGFGLIAWRNALSRNFAAHRRWALRTFIVASGVWFMRVGYMVWGISTGGIGSSEGMSGPFDLIWAFATYLLPLAMLELYLAVESKGTPAGRQAVAVLLGLSAIAIAGGSIAAWLLMWSPYL